MHSKASASFNFLYHNFTPTEDRPIIDPRPMPDHRLHHPPQHFVGEIIGLQCRQITDDRRQMAEEQWLLGGLAAEGGVGVDGAADHSADLENEAMGNGKERL